MQRRAARSREPSEAGWYNPPTQTAFRGGEGKTGARISTTEDLETGLIYVHDILFHSADGPDFYPEERMDYFMNYGIDHSVPLSTSTPSPTPTPSVWLTMIEISPSSPKDGIAVGETVQFIATGTYSDGSTKDITSQAMWFSTNMHATVSPAGLAIGMSPGDTFIFVNMSGVGSHVYLDVK